MSDSEIANGVVPQFHNIVQFHINVSILDGAQ